MLSANVANSQGSAASWSPSPEHLEALAEFAAGAGHEINNPLATIIGRAQQLLREETDPQRRQSLSIIATQAYRVRDMIGDVMTFARPPAPERRVFDAVAAIRTVVEKLRVTAACQIEIHGVDSTTIDADPVQFAVVISELIRNAILALQPTGGLIQISVTPHEDAVQFAVTDHGKGFTPQERKHAFDPFFSGRQAGRGLGFGLCKAARIVDLHGGTIEITSSPGGPTTVTAVWSKRELCREG
jgi:signal transduction histidine kinase